MMVNIRYSFYTCFFLLSPFSLVCRTFLVALSPSEKKKWVDKKSGYICFMLYARSFWINWGQCKRYWTWDCLKETSDENVEIAKLLAVCAFDVSGSLKISELSPDVDYEIAFIIKLTKSASGWEPPTKIRFTLPDGKSQERQVCLLEEPRGEWIELNIGRFRTKNGESGEISFSLESITPYWKSGLVFKGAIIRPRN